MNEPTLDEFRSMSRHEQFTVRKRWWNTLTPDQRETEIALAQDVLSSGQPSRVFTITDEEEMPVKVVNMTRDMAVDIMRLSEE